MRDATTCGRNVSRTTVDGRTGQSWCTLQRSAAGNAKLDSRALIQRDMSRDVEQSDTDDDTDDIPPLHRYTQPVSSHLPIPGSQSRRLGLGTVSRPDFECIGLFSVSSAKVSFTS